MKPSVTGKKTVSTNTAPTSRKKALQGLLILRPSSSSKAVTVRDVSSEDSNDDESNSQIEGKRKGSKKDRAQESSISSSSSSLPTLIVGRSSKQNDRITFEIAKEHHLWFHVQVRCKVQDLLYSVYCILYEVYCVLYRAEYSGEHNTLLPHLLYTLGCTYTSHYLNGRY